MLCYNKMLTRNRVLLSQFPCRTFSSITDTLKKLDRNKVKRTPTEVIDPYFEPEGYELVLHRASNIIKNVTENQSTKMLQLYCDGLLLQKIGKVSHIEAIGCTDNEISLKQAQKFHQYSSCEILDYSKELPFRNNTFQIITLLFPPNNVVSPFNNMLLEVQRLLNHNGYALIGASDTIWNDNKIFERLQAIDAEGNITFLSMQSIKINDPDGLYSIAVIRKL